MRPELAALIADPPRAAEVPVEERQALLDALAAHEGRCRQVRDLAHAVQHFAGGVGHYLCFEFGDFQR